MSVPATELTGGNIAIPFLKFIQSLLNFLSITTGFLGVGDSNRRKFPRRSVKLGNEDLDYGIRYITRLILFEILQLPYRFRERVEHLFTLFRVGMAGILPQPRIKGVVQA